jgi:hypothetical protein
MLLKVIDSNPYANIVNYMVTGYIPVRADKKMLVHKSRKHLWDDPYLYRVCNDGLLRKCVPAREGLQIIEKCHVGPYGGIMVFSTHMQKSGRVFSSNQPCMMIPWNSFEDAKSAKNVEESPQEMQCL